MATAKRLYLYVVSATGLGMAIFGAISMLHLLLNKIGLGPQSSAASSLTSNADKDQLSVAIAVGVVGLALWLIHWAIAERMVHGSSEVAAAERASIVRSVYFAVVMAVTLVAAASLAVQLAGDSLANGLNARQSFSFQIVDDSWSLAAIIVLFAVWGHYAWCRAHDIRQGTPITGAAAWVSRLYLYGVAFVGLLSVLGALSSIIVTAVSQLLPNTTTAPYGVDPFLYLGISQPSTPTWVRPVVAAVVGIAIWGLIWLSHWLYSNKLRSGQDDQSYQSFAERTSRVRLAFLMLVVLWGVSSVASGLAAGLGSLFSTMLGQKLGPTPMWYVVVVPPISALPAAAAWWLHRRRALSEAPYGPAGVSARRVAGYLVALVGLGLIVSGATQALATIFGQWFPGPSSSSFYPGISVINDFWKYQLGASAGMILAGLILWVWPWFSAQRRRGYEWAIEVGSSARSYYLYAVVGSALLAGAFGLAMVWYRYLRVGFGLPEKSLASEVVTPFAILLVAVALFAYHAFVMRSDMKGTGQPKYVEPVAPMAPVDAPAAPMAPMAPMAPVDAPVDAPVTAPVAPVDAPAAPIDPGAPTA
jgi:hypothetical protein